MNTPKTNGIIRHILTLIGSILMAFGWLNEDLVNEGIDIAMQIAGLVTVIISFVRSFNAPEKKISDQEYRNLKAVG